MTKLSATELRAWADQSVPGGVTWKGDEGLILCPFHDDHNPSCGINVAKFAYNCHACGAHGDLRELAEHLGKPLPGEDPWEPPREPTMIPSEEIVYQYQKGGVTLFEKVRVVKDGRKSFFQRRADGNGGYINNLKGVERVLYRMDELREALADGKPVFVVEGEKDADALVARGMEATTNVEGAGKWLDEYTAVFPEGALVYICGDFDRPGQEHVKMLSVKLHDRGCRVWIIDLGYEVTDSHGKDVSDWLGEHDGAEWGRLVEETREMGAVDPLPVEDLDSILNSPPTEFLIEGWLPLHSVSVLCSMHGVGKTWIALTAACAVMAGGFLWEHYGVHHSGPVLLIDQENPRSMLGDRLRRLGITTDSPFHVVLHNDEARLDDGAGLLKIKATIDAVKPALVVLDSLVEFHGLEENSEEMKRVMRGLRDLRDATETTFLVLHHRPKNSKGIETAARGSTAITAGCDAMLVLDKGDRDDHWTLQSGKMRVAEPFGPAKLALSVDDDSAAVSWEGNGVWKSDSKALQQLLDDQAILGIIDASQVPLSTSEIAREAGHNRQRTGRILQHLEESGVIKSNRPGRERMWSHV